MLLAVFGSGPITRPFFVASLLGCSAGAWSCGSGGNRPPEPDAAADASADTSLNDAETSSCGPSDDALEPDVPAQLDLEGGVPLDQVSFATAVAHCTYWNRCLPMAAYVQSECIAFVSQSGAWTYVECGPFMAPNETGYLCQGLGFYYTRYGAEYPGAALRAAVDAGVVTYDPDAEAACLRALQAQGCHGPDFFYDIPDCTHVFSCAQGAGTTDAAATDAGATCANLGLSASFLPMARCVVDSDCAADAAPPAGPYCVSGYCVSSPCDALLQGRDGGCQPLVDAGQPCDSDPPWLGRTLNGTPWGTEPTKTCAAGLTCRGVSADGGLGTCAVPQEIGGPCLAGAAVQGCALGLVCQCGVCRMPPAQGPCVAGACLVGVAYCDLQSQTCRAVRPVGGDCTAASLACAPNLTCDSTTNTCQPPPMQ
jgi:hypothetical protein